MLAKNKLAKLENQLEEAQKYCKARLLTMDEIKNAIEKAEQAIKKVDSKIKQNCTYVYNPHSVAKSYKYTAEGTWLEVQFNKAGKATEARVYRHYVGNQNISRIVVSIECLSDFVKNELGIENPDYFNDKPAYDKFCKLITIVEKANGFNGNGYMNIQLLLLPTRLFLVGSDKS